MIFLQNVVVDLLLGLGFKDAFRIFADHVRDRYDAEPGFITMNLPLLLDALDEVGIENPIVCANINKIGFRMCGGIAAYEDALRERALPRRSRCRSSPPARFRRARRSSGSAASPNIESIVFGASSRANIRGTRELVDEFWRP